MRHYNKLTWPKNASSSPISEDLDFKNSGQEFLWTSLQGMTALKILYLNPPSLKIGPRLIYCSLSSNFCCLKQL